MTESKQSMPGVQTTSRCDIDSATSAMMRKVIGERLEQHLGPDAPMPDRLQRLLDQLRRQDDGQGG